MRIPTARRMGSSVFLLCMGIILFPVYRHWVSTRTWIAVDMPISLAPGRIRISNFRVNLSAAYNINIDLNDYEYWRDLNCESRDVIQSRWWLSRNGRAVSSWKDYWGEVWSTDPNDPARGSDLGAFDGSGGTYDLEVQMVSDGTCLQKFHPRLRVSANNGDYIRGGWIYAAVILVSCGLLGIGLAFPLVSLTGRAHISVQLTHGENLTIFDPLRTDHESLRRKLLLAEPRSNLPTIGYIYAQTYLVLFLIFAPFVLAKWQVSYGIPVRLLRPGIIQASTNSGTTGLLVYVDIGGNMYLNSKPVKVDELPRVLELELGRRADWSVYVDGDSNAEYADVVRAMALVRSVGGKVIMLTPGLRAEAEAQRKSSVH